MNKELESESKWTSTDQSGQRLFKILMVWCSVSISHCEPSYLMFYVITYFVGALSRVSHKGLYLGWIPTTIFLLYAAQNVMNLISNAQWSAIALSGPRKSHQITRHSLIYCQWYASLHVKRTGKKLSRWTCKKPKKNWGEGRSGEGRGGGDRECLAPGESHKAMSTTVVSVRWATVDWSRRKEWN